MALSCMISLSSLSSALSIKTVAANHDRYKTLLIIGATLHMIVITGHLVDSSITPLIKQGYSGLETIQFVAHTLIYRLQIHFWQFVLFSTAIFYRIQSYRDVIGYSNNVANIMRIVLWVSNALFLSVPAIMVPTFYSTCSVNDVECFLKVRESFLLPSITFSNPVFVAQVHYYLLEIGFGAFAYYYVITEIPTTDKNFQTSCTKINRFLLLWTCNSVLLLAVMIVYCFIEIGSPLVLSLCGVMISLQYYLCVKFTDIVALMMKLKVSCVGADVKMQSRKSPKTRKRRVVRLEE